MIAKVVGVLSGLASIIALVVSLYPLLTRGNVVLTVDKDVVTAPPQLVSLGAWASKNHESLKSVCKSPELITPKGAKVACDIPDLPDFDLYNRADFGSVTVGITNRRQENVPSTTLRISGLKSFQGVTANSNFLNLSTNLAGWNKQELMVSPTGTDNDNKNLLLSLPELPTGGYIRLTAYGLNSGFADADILGMPDRGPTRVYVVKSSAPQTSSIPPWIAGAFLVASVFLIGVAFRA